MQIVFSFAFATFLFISVVSLFVWRVFREEGAFLYWSVSALLGALGWGVFSLAGPEISFVVRCSVSETLIFASHVVGFLALVRLGTNRNLTFQLYAWGFATGLFFALDWISRALAFHLWDGAVALIHSILNLMMIAMFLRERRPENRGIVYSVCAVYLLLGVLATLGKVFEVFTVAKTAVEITSDASVNFAVVLGTTTMIAVSTIGVALLAFTRSAQAMKELARLDPLTLALNRRAWQTSIDEECKRVKRGGPSFSVIMLDLDHFKSINDKYGHAAGDEALKTLARVVRSQIREIDLLSRYGGEEFLVLMVGGAFRDAFGVAERVRQSVAAAPIESGGKKFSITCSVGVAHYDPAQDNADSVVARADEAMYKAKGEGRNRVIVAENRRMLAY